MVKVGDHIRCTKKWADCTVGNIYSVVSVASNGDAFIRDDVGDENVLNPDEYEIITDANPEALTGYPDDNPKSVVGATKPPLSPIPPVALIELGQAMKDGKSKYGLMNWRTSGVAASVYYDAAMRHLLAWYDGEDIAEDSGVHHLAHAMACFAIVLDASHSGTLTDDRPVKGPASYLIKKLTETK